MSDKKFDIVVLGGGLVGLSVANLLAQQGFQVAVVEKKYPVLEWENADFDLRCSAISKGSQQIFQQLGVWDSMQEERVSPYCKMVVWDALGFGEVKFDAAEVAEPVLGHIIENRVMLKSLFEQAKSNTNITFFTGKIPVSLEVNIQQALLKIVATEEHLNQTVLQAKCVVGADGGYSWLREHEGMLSYQNDYHQSALVATVKTELSHQMTAWQRFLPEGPLAFLPLKDPHLCSIVWTTSLDKITEFLTLTHDERCEILAHLFDYRLGKILAVSSSQNFPLKSLEVKQMVKDRIVLIGDAAHVIHPLAGLGVNLGLQDAKILRDIFSENKDNDIGNIIILRKYERARKGQVKAILHLMSFFKNLFQSQKSWMIGIRSIGMNFFNQSQIWKKRTIAEAMGITREF